MADFSAIRRYLNTDSQPEVLAVRRAVGLWGHVLVVTSYTFEVRPYQIKKIPVLSKSKSRQLVVGAVCNSPIIQYTAHTALNLSWNLISRLFIEHPTRGAHLHITYSNIATFAHLYTYSATIGVIVIVRAQFYLPLNQFTIVSICVRNLFTFLADAPL
jgi:hypothetical protein